MSDDPPEQDPAGSGAPELDPHGQLAELLGAPDRDRCPGARPVVSVSEHDDPEYIAEVTAHCHRTPLLERRGVEHGAMAELGDDHVFLPSDPMAALARRWKEARPIVLHDALPEGLLDEAGWGVDHLPPATDKGLARLVASALEAGGGGFRDIGPRGHLRDERDRAARRIRFTPREDAKGPGGPVDDLWVKTQALSTHPDDASMRLRVSFGREGRDDGSRDAHRHRLVARLAERLFPELVHLHRDEELRGLIGEWMGSRPLMTQTIAYWNAPSGGAMFHHDAFDEPAEGGQRGVLYAQVSGSTFWLALSLEDLARRVVEFAELIDEGVVGWPDAPGPHLDALDVARAGHEAAARELWKPGCGALACMVNQGPDFTALLADAGHGFVLGPGDAIVMPGFGMERTCMHAVFCAEPDADPAFSFSMALRDSAPARPAGAVSRRGTRRGRGRRRGARSRPRRGRRLGSKPRRN